MKKNNFIRTLVSVSLKKNVSLKINFMVILSKPLTEFSIASFFPLGQIRQL